MKLCETHRLTCVLDGLGYLQGTPLRRNRSGLPRGAPQRRHRRQPAGEPVAGGHQQRLDVGADAGHVLGVAPLHGRLVPPPPAPCRVRVPSAPASAPPPVPAPARPPSQ